jgi:hypothetical protein
MLVAWDASRALDREPIAVCRRVEWVVISTNKGGTAGNSSRPFAGREF